jgi:hypothetical protein
MPTTIRRPRHTNHTSMLVVILGFRSATIKTGSSPSVRSTSHGGPGPTARVSNLPLVKHIGSDSVTVSVIAALLIHGLDR